MAKKKSVVINISECQNCDNQTGLTVIRETVENVRTLTNMLELNADIYLGDNDFVIESEPGYSRRDFIKLFRNKVAGKVSDAIDSVNRQVPADSFREKKIPEHRKLQTGALIRSEDNSKVTLKHDVDFCVKCGLCSEICPRKTIKYRENVELSIFNRKLKVELREFPKFRCRDCGRDFIATKDSLFCNACLAKKQLADEFLGF